MGKCDQDPHAKFLWIDEREKRTRIHGELWRSGSAVSGIAGLAGPEFAFRIVPVLR